MDPRIPALLHPLLHNYMRGIDQELPDRITAVYLEGSLALDGFNPRLSDIDFVGVLSGQVTAGDFEKIIKVHQMIENRYPAWKLSGRYVQAADLGCLDHTSLPHLNYHDGKLKWSDEFKLSSVTWWILKNRGIAVFGPPPESLAFTVDIDAIIQGQRENLNTYWASWTTRPDGLLALLSDWGIQWTVLGVLRQFYTFHERAITSKIKAGEYGLTCLPERWHSIIREAIALREDPEKPHYRSRVKRAFEAYHFLKYIIQTCNQYLDASRE